MKTLEHHNGWNRSGHAPEKRLRELVRPARLGDNVAELTADLIGYLRERTEQNEV